MDRPISVSAAFEGSKGIAAARDLARSFLADLHALHGLTVSAPAQGMVQLVVSELVTNTGYRRGEPKRGHGMILLRD
ncbi:hypothetical protein [Streptomyces sp. NPDC001070]